MNRKNAIEKSLYVIFIIVVVVAITILMSKNDRLQETLNENEKVISDMGKIVDTLNQKNKELENNLISVGQENTDLKTNLQKSVDEVQTLKNDKEKLQSDLSSLDGELKKTKSELAKVRSELAKKTKPVAAYAMPSRGTPNGRTIYVVATAYTAYCAGCTGKTATGINLRANPGLKVIAVDPKIIPLGSKVWVDGYGYAIAGDTGGAIKGHKIDIFIPSRSKAYEWGRRTVQLKVLN